MLPPDKCDFCGKRLSGKDPIALVSKEAAEKIADAIGTSYGPASSRDPAGIPRWIVCGDCVNTLYGKKKAME
jgi:hypothetical protein